MKSNSWKRFIPLAVLMVLMGTVYLTDIYMYLSIDMLKDKHQVLKEFVKAHPYSSPIFFTLIYALTVALCLPGGALLSLVGGYLFPFPWNALYVLIAATTGASIIFLAARTAFGDILKEKAGPFLKEMEKGFEENGWSYLLFLRFAPIFPFWLVNLAAAFFQVPFVTFVWTTVVGILPGTFAFTQAGAGIGAIFESDQPFSLVTVFNTKLKVALLLIGFLSLAPILIKNYLERKQNKG